MSHSALGFLLSQTSLFISFFLFFVIGLDMKRHGAVKKAMQKGNDQGYNHSFSFNWIRHMKKHWALKNIMQGPEKIKLISRHNEYKTINMQYKIVFIRLTKSQHATVSKYLRLSCRLNNITSYYKRFHSKMIIGIVDLEVHSIPVIEYQAESIPHLADVYFTDSKKVPVYCLAGRKISSRQSTKARIPTRDFMHHHRVAFITRLRTSLTIKRCFNLSETPHCVPLLKCSSQPHD